MDGTKPKIEPSVSRDSCCWNLFQKWELWFDVSTHRQFKMAFPWPRTLPYDTEMMFLLVLPCACFLLQIRSQKQNQSRSVSIASKDSNSEKNPIQKTNPTYKRWSTSYAFFLSFLLASKEVCSSLAIHITIWSPVIFSIAYIRVVLS